MADAGQNSSCRIFKVCDEIPATIYIVRVLCSRVKVIGNGVKYLREHGEFRVVNLLTFEAIPGGFITLKDWNERTDGLYGWHNLGEEILGEIVIKVWKEKLINDPDSWREFNEKAFDIISLNVWEEFLNEKIREAITIKIIRRDFFSLIMRFRL